MGPKPKGKNRGRFNHRTKQFQFEYWHDWEQKFFQQEFLLWKGFRFALVDGRKLDEEYERFGRHGENHGSH